MRIQEAPGWSFDKLAREGLSLIPAYAPDWTNHNASDPGITLVELLAYISEILIYRALRITPDAKFNFLRLLGPPENVQMEGLVGQPAHVIEEAIRARVAEMTRANAVTPADFEALAASILHRLLGIERFRVKCLPGVDLQRMPEAHGLVAVESPPDVTVVIALEQTPGPRSDASLVHEVQQELQQHCLLTMRAYVRQAVELHLSVTCRIAPQPGFTLADVIEAIDAALDQRFDPLPRETSWDASPFGRTLHLASVAGAIDRTDGVDFVENVAIAGIAIPGSVGAEQAWVGIRIGTVSRVGEDTWLGGRASIPVRRLQTDTDGEAEAFILQPWEVIRVRLERDAVHRISDEGEFDNSGDQRLG
jgi:hypothetical protein